MVALLKMPNRMRLVPSEPDYAAADLMGSDAAAAGGPERRMFPRKALSLTIEGRRIDHAVAARQHPQLCLALRDLSVGGLSALVDVPVIAGERLSVSFPPQGLNRGWEAFGRVIRCQPSGAGYRIAVEFDALPAAA